MNKLCLFVLVKNYPIKQSYAYVNLELFPFKAVKENLEHKKRAEV